MSETRTYPASFAQQRLWFIDQLEPGSSLYNVPILLRLRGAVQAEALGRAIDQLVARHETLRTTFSLSPQGGPLQVVAEPRPAMLDIVDATAVPLSSRDAEAERFAAEESVRPFDLASGPVFRARLMRLAPDDHVLTMVLHHIVSDGWSVSVLFQELSALYAGLLSGRAAQLPPLPMQYGEYATWQRERLSGSRLKQELAHWQTRLEGAPSLLELPADRPRPASSSYRGARETALLPPALTRALGALSRSEGATLFMSLVAGLAALLGRYSGQSDVIIGSPIAGRVRPELEKLIGFFVNTLVLRVNLEGAPSFRTLLQRVRSVALDAFEHQELPFERLVEALQPERSLGHTPLVQVLLAMQNTPRGGLVLPGVNVQTIRDHRYTAKFDLTLSARETDNGLELRADYAIDLFDGGTIARLLNHYRTVLESAVAAPDRPLAAIPLVSASEREALTARWATGPRSPYPSGETIASLFAEQAAAAPDAIALESADGQLTYGELDRRAAHLAARLSRAGAAPDSPVGVLLERSTDLIVALVAVLKAGAAYLPLDPQDPAERLRLILADSGTQVLLTHAPLGLDVADPGVATVAIDGDDDAEASPPPIPDVGPDHLACVMYTSGSTGTPKGVAVTHRNVLRLIRGTDYVRFGPDRVFLQLAPAAFDASTFEIWGALLNGARLAIAPPGLLTPEELATVLRRHRVTTLWLTAGFFHLVVDENLAALECLDELIVGGDVVSLPHVRRLLRELPGCRIVNGYGPTEATTFATCHQVREAGGSAPTVAIGRPMANVQVYVLDRYLEPVPVGVPGELFIGGDGVTRGYLRRPGQTAERYLPDPFAVTPGRRLYRTGDRVRWRPGGVLEFLGRLDRQLKVRGFRVEPAEVEAVLAGHPGIRACAVDVAHDGRGDRRLVAYVAADDSLAGTYELRSFLRERLPDYLVPASFIRVDRLPLTASGKIDRAALPRPNDLTADSEAPFVAPQTPTEALLAALWAELLNAPRVGVHHNFFALGGHSLLATQVVSRIRRAFGVDLPLRALFELPTIAELAERIELVRREAPSAERPLVRLPRAAYRLEDSPRGGPAGRPWPPSSDGKP